MLDHEMDLTIGSFNFHVGSLGSLSLLDLIPSGPSNGKIAHASTPATFVGSSNEVNLPASIKPMEGKRSIVKKLDEIMENLDLKECNIPRFYQILGEIFAFVLLEMIGISQGFKTF
jgi:hypothetical protein